MPNSRERKRKFDFIESKIGKTPLTEVVFIDDREKKRDVKIYVKEEYRNPTGSHYDRLTLELFRGKEDCDFIRPEENSLIETTTGSSGASFAWLAKILGYSDVTLVIPEDMPSARIAQIESYGAKIIFSEKNRYIDGLLDFTRKELKGLKEKNPNLEFLDHSRDVEFCKIASVKLIDEIFNDFDNIKRIPSHAIFALGNGCSAAGAISECEIKKIETYGMEPYESPIFFKRYFKEEFQEKFPKYNSYKKLCHEIYGTGAGNKMHIFPNLKNIGESKALKTVFHPNRDDVISAKEKLIFNEMILAGNSSAACYWAAIELSKTVPDGSNIFTIMYDAAWRYLPYR